MPDQPEVETPARLARRQQDGAYRVIVNGEPVMQIPNRAKQLQLRLMVGAHMMEGDHRSVRVTLSRVQIDCLRMEMKATMQEFV